MPKKDEITEPPNDLRALVKEMRSDIKTAEELDDSPRYIEGLSDCVAKLEAVLTNATR